MRSLLGGLAAALSNRVPVPYTGRSRVAAMFGSNTGRDAQMAAMGSVGTLFSIVNRTSTATAQVNWRLYRKAKSGKKEDRQEVTSHAALDLWNTPNPFYTRQLLVESSQQHIDLTGEGWLVVARHPAVRSLPLELWPVRPDRIEPVPDRDNFLAGYVYLGPDGERVPLELDEVISLRMPNPRDPYRGLGPVQSILTDLDSTRYSAEWNRNFFRNSAEPGGIVQVDKRLGDDEFNELRDRWNEQHKGVANAHRVAILEQGKWVERHYSQRDMQFAELRGVSRDVIREAYGISGFALGDIDDVNRATADASKTWFAEMLTVPRLERFKQALNTRLLPMYGTTGQSVEFDYDDPVPPNAEALNQERDSRAASAKALVEAGYHPDDVADAMGLPRMRYVGRDSGQARPAEQA